MEGDNKKWTSLETRKLISEFEESPCLWNAFGKDCKNKDRKARALTKIALSLGFSVYEVKRKLNNFRCQYNSELKKQESRNLDKAQVKDVSHSGRILMYFWRSDSRGCRKCEGNNWEFTLPTRGDSRE
jgi:hypothetical protein